MALKKRSLLGAFLILPGLLWAARQTPAGPAQERIVRLAELEIDPAQLDAYRAALREEIEASIRLEPGVLTLNAVAVKDHPTQIRLFEMYASLTAYQAAPANTSFPEVQSYDTRNGEIAAAYRNRPDPARLTSAVAQGKRLAGKGLRPRSEANLGTRNRLNRP